MLEPKQIGAVLLAAVAAVTALWALSLVAGFIIAHILPIAGLSLALAAYGVWYLAREAEKPAVKPKA